MVHISECGSLLLDGLEVYIHVYKVIYCTVLGHSSYTKAGTSPPGQYVEQPTALQY